ncbi:hypothetical protein FACS189431_0990 [Alphaproteobacteria bacterium]|nr:hypothetical protein FACS189431_0990 [Alphaproteobacteria bacterium]
MSTMLRPDMFVYDLILAKGWRATIEDVFECQKYILDRLGSLGFSEVHCPSGSTKASLEEFFTKNCAVEKMNDETITIRPGERQDLKKTALIVKGSICIALNDTFESGGISYGMVQELVDKIYREQGGYTTLCSKANLELVYNRAA